MKRFFSLLLAIVICILTLSFVSYSKEESIVFSYRRNYGSHARNLDSFYTFIGPKLDSFADCILDAVVLEKDFIDIEHFEIPATENMFRGIEQFIWKELPAAFNVHGIGFYTNDFAGRSLITGVYVSYSIDSQTYVDMLNACEQAAETVLFGIKGNDSLTQIEKALLIHDRIAALCEYDLEFGPNCYNMYGVLVQKAGVCEGYTMAYKYLLDQVGVQSYYCSSDQLNHAWNILVLEGETYHVDITWDDPIPNMPSRACHSNFLRSTCGFVETGHRASDYDQSPISTQYDRAYWQSSTSEFQLIENDVFFLDNSNEYLCKVTEDGNEQILSIDDTWWADGGYYGENYSKLSSSCKTLIYSLSDSVYSYSVKTGQSQLIFKPALAPGEAIYGMSYDGERIFCYIGTSPDTYTRTELKPYSIPEEEHSFEHDSDLQCDVCGAMRKSDIPGDLNCVDGVNSDDAIYLLYSALLGESRYPLNQNCDFNKDGDVDSDDAIYLLYHVLLGAQRYPLL